MASTLKPARTFNRMVANPVLEDYALRYARRRFRRWSIYAIATAALGGIATWPITRSGARRGG